MKKMIAVLLLSASSAWALTCPAGEHSQCVNGGRYSPPSCSCVSDTCHWELQTVNVGGTIYSYSQTSATYPDSCSNYVVDSTCVAQNTLNPPPQNFNCQQLYPGQQDDS